MMSRGVMLSISIKNFLILLATLPRFLSVAERFSAAHNFAFGGVRGIATGDVSRRLVSRALAQGWADTFDQASRPYQFALKARAGTDALAAHVRASLDMRPDAVVVSLDGRNAYDSMSRAAFLSALNSCAPELVPFVRMWYGDPSTYFWWDVAGQCREVSQGEGCEQGDPLAPPGPPMRLAAFGHVRVAARQPCVADGPPLRGRLLRPVAR